MYKRRNGQQNHLTQVPAVREEALNSNIIPFPKLGMDWNNDNTSFLCFTGCFLFLKCFLSGETLQSMNTTTEINSSSISPGSERQPSQSASNNGTMETQKSANYPQTLVQHQSPPTHKSSMTQLALRRPANISKQAVQSQDLVISCDSPLFSPSCEEHVGGDTVPR